MTFEQMLLSLIVAIIITAGSTFLSPRRSGEGLTTTVRALSQKLDAAYAELEAVKEENRHLKADLAALRAEMRIMRAAVVVRPDTQNWSPVPQLLVIFGPDEKVAGAFETALNKACVDYTRLYSATRATVDDELRRRRDDGNFYSRILIAAHGTPDGIRLGGGDILMPKFWNEKLAGVDVLMLASCSSAEVADAMAGVARFVIYFREDVLLDDAVEFAEVFWRSVDNGQIVERAYIEARKAVPGVARFVDIRVARRQKTGESRPG